MKVRWNSYETVPLEMGGGPDDYIVEVYDPNNNLLTVKLTEYRTSGEVFIKVNARRGSSDVEPSPLQIDQYAINVTTYEQDHIPMQYAPILRHEVHGKTLRIWVDACLPN